MALTLDVPAASSDFMVVGDTMHVATITVPAHLRGCGLGSVELDRLCALADVRGWAMELMPSDVLGTPLAILVPWYNRRGFWPVSGTKAMRREPRCNKGNVR